MRVYVSVWLLVLGCTGELPPEQIEPLKRYREFTAAPTKSCNINDPAVMADVEYRPSLLTPNEVDNILRDLFAEQVAADPEILRLASAVPDAPVDETLDHTIYAANNRGFAQSQLLVLTLVEIAERLAAQLASQPDFARSCSLAPTCLEKEVLPLAQRLWRGELSTAEQDLLASIMNDTSHPVSENFQTALMTVMGSPRFYVKHRRPSTPDDSNPSELVHRFSFFLVDSVPDDALHAALQAGEINAPEDLIPHVHRLLDNPAYARRFAERSIGAWLEYESDLQSTLQVHLNKKSTTELGTALQPLVSRVQQVITNDRTLGSIFDATGGLSWFESMHFAHRTTPEEMTVVTERGLFIARKLLCLPIPINEVDPELVATVLGPEPDRLSQLEVSEIRRDTPACAGCHGEADKFGTALEQIDQYGSQRTHYDDGTPIEFAFELGEREVNSFSEFATAFGADPRVNRCFARTLASKFTPVIRTSPQACLDEDALSADDTVRDLVVHLVTSPLFLASVTTTGAEDSP